MKKKKKDTTEPVAEIGTAKKKLKRCVNCGQRSASKGGICADCGQSKKVVAEHSGDVQKGTPAPKIGGVIVIRAELVLRVPVMASVSADPIAASTEAMATVGHSLQCHPDIAVLASSFLVDSESGASE